MGAQTSTESDRHYETGVGREPAEHHQVIRQRSWGNNVYAPYRSRDSPVTEATSSSRRADENPGYEQQVRIMPSDQQSAPNQDQARDSVPEKKQLVKQKSRNYMMQIKHE
ncbi:uncharacterized protein LOC141905937 [Tubulanus polymorphus]|uniref:uncharacterized protein LOC141905937 n=1 Tax=Tubulanus polymorphus TaxID=672921 RepID=UPI003DA3ABF6